MNINQQNYKGNTALHIHNEPKIILNLLKNNIDINLTNNDEMTALQYHYEKKNYDIYDLIVLYISAKKIQNKWRCFWFKKTFIPIKYYKKKKDFINNFKLLPPSECNLFPGGIEYQKIKTRFESFLN